MLLVHPEQLQKLTENPQLINNAIEEILRFCPGILKKNGEKKQESEKEKKNDKKGKPTNRKKSKGNRLKTEKGRKEANKEM